ncbi:DASH complex subunit Ask1 [Penicillium robsamsonii]|uniref:DASH complex subunit Ask1 n=1 Tax=Penicillium robsamsonii TaxID=1792511 RepID=UPI0025486E23|nr:DASH complex subunit Ask1 [Penicillium robsamsonii]KAJ5826725.1 DASH complex subunit Ask1 [Penicillium robsamsonii]
MSRQPSQAQRPLSLTEELEKLEQSITLTLQEIDHNFSQAHRIVTTSILPLVEQYTEHSRDVWEGSKFWKQFFEASANVSLSGYEERNTDEETMQDPTATEEELSTDITQSTSLDETMSHDTPSYQRHETPHSDQAGDLDLTDLAISSHSTPRAPGHHQPADDDMTTSSMEYSSSYENLRRQVNESEPPFDLPDSSALPSTPGRQLFFPRGVSATTPMSSPFLPPASQSQTQDRRYQKTSDPVLHQMLDKTYRVQATPLGKGFRNVGGGTDSRSKFNVTTPKPAETTSKYAYDDSPISSPEPEAPQLHSEIFSSPIKGIDTPGTNRRRRTSSNRMRGIPKPGMSVLTPAKKSAAKSAMWDSDDDFDDDDEDLGPSPPKTMQFHIPQSRLMRTPAREASKRIVTDLLATAGAGDITDDFDDDQSPSVIRRMERLEDETF